MNEELNKSYQVQLEQWVEAWKRQTGLPQEQLGSFMQHVSFGEKDKYPFQSLPSYTLSRTITNRPGSRADGKYNLYKLLGVLFEFKVIPSEQAIQQFLMYHHIEPPPDKSWAELWQALQAGVERSRSYTNTKSTTNTRRSRRLHLNRPIRRFWLFVPFLLLVLAATWVYPQATQPDNLGVIRHTNNWCSATPQGFISLGNGADLMYIPSDVPIDNFAANPFYVYFHETYVGSDVLSFDGLNTTKGEWQAHILPAWVKTHGDWNTPSLWRIDFSCAK